MVRLWALLAGVAALTACSFAKQVRRSCYARDWARCTEVFDARAKVDPREIREHEVTRAAFKDLVEWLRQRCGDERVSPWDECLSLVILDHDLPTWGAAHF